MKTAEEIYSDHYLKSLGKHGSPMHDTIIPAMKEYAEQAIQEVLKRAAETVWQKVNESNIRNPNELEHQILNTEYRDLLK